MIDGSYKEHVDWEAYECPEASFILTENCNGKSRRYKTCGSAALSLLTNLDPRDVEKHLPKSQQHWSDRAALAFLKRRKFKVHPISRYGVTNIDPNGDWESFPLNANHVLLCNLLMCKNEASWWVVSGGRTFHNFEVRSLSPLFLFNKPSQSVYVVSHKSWK